jgi:hypothetical protein
MRVYTEQIAFIAAIISVLVFLRSLCLRERVLFFSQRHEEHKELTAKAQGTERTI